VDRKGVAVTRRLLVEHKGFSMIETMVAVFVLVVGILAVSTMYLESQRVVHETERRRTALWLTRDKIGQKIGSPYPELTMPGAGERLADGVLTGEDEPGGMFRTWTVQPDRPQPEIALIRATTKWTERGRPRSVTLVALKARGSAP
jgi:prepilin-type N-terminal cleavage/methylation domain-containing protein